MIEDLKKLHKAAKTGKCRTLALFGSYGKNEGAIIDGKPINDLDLLLVDASDEVVRELGKLELTVPVDVLSITSEELKTVPQTQMWWEIARGHQVIYGEPLDMVKMPSWEIPYWDAVMSLDKRCVSMMLGKYEMMKEKPNHIKIRSQIGKMIIALGDAILIKRGQFDHRYSVRALMLDFDDIAPIYRLAVNWKMQNWPESDPDEVWRLWNRVRNILRDYVMINQISVPKLDDLLSIDETTEQNTIKELIIKHGGEKFI